MPKVGTAYADKILDTLYEAYNTENAIYFVIEKDGEVFGGAGVKQLENYDGNVCELQKMYFLPEARGIGLGSKMMNICLQKAKEFEFKQCYLETFPGMKAAINLYKKNGFQIIDKALGNTSHYSCNV